jgi:hypothetical protein
VVSRATDLENVDCEMLVSFVLPENCPPTLSAFLSADKTNAIYTQLIFQDSAPV